MTAATITVRTAGELFDLLGSTDLALRRAAMAAVRADPGKALGYGAEQGRDVVDHLSAALEQTQGPARLELLQTLGSFEDSRATDVLKRELRQSDEVAVTEFLLELLLRGDPARLRSFAVELALEDVSPERSHAGAVLLSRLPDLTIRERLRVGLALQSPETPALCVETSSEWITELDGPFALEARDRLEPLGADDVELLEKGWDRLSADARTWLVGVEATAALSRLPRVAKLAIADHDEDLIVAGLEAVAEAGDVADAELRAGVLSKLGDASPAVRRAAIDAAPDDTDWQRLIAHERDPGCRAAIVSRLAQVTREVAPFQQLLADEAWQVRASAREALDDIVARPSLGAPGDSQSEAATRTRSTIRGW